MKIEITPHDIHLLFCTNTRADGGQSCGDTDANAQLAVQLKERFKNNKWPVRISRTACLGPCAQGPNIFAYPQKAWMQKVELEDIDAIEMKVKELLDLKS
jgi:(2Fe-2S) ferredoxin